MMLRKAGQSNTAAGNISVRTHVGASVCDNIAAIYGSQIAKDLIEVVHNDEKLQFKVVFCLNLIRVCYIYCYYCHSLH